VFPYPRSGQVFCDLIPTAGEQVRIEGAAHFLQEDRGEQIGQRVAEFVAGGQR
jgi:haloalkane dehalogenase